MTVSMTQQARNGRLIALLALKARKHGGDDAVILMPRPTQEPVTATFSSTRGHPSAPAPALRLVA